VPVAPVALHLAEGGWHLIRCGFELLQANDIRTLLRDPFLDLRLARPDTVDVPGGEFQCDACAAWRSGPGIAISAGWASRCAATIASAFAIASGSPRR